MDVGQVVAVQGPLGGGLHADPGALEIFPDDAVNPKSPSTTTTRAFALHVACSTETARWLRFDDTVTATLAVESAYLTTRFSPITSATLWNTFIRRGDATHVTFGGGVRGDTT